MQESLRHEWGTMPAFMELAKRVGADIDAPVRWYDHGSWIHKDYHCDGVEFASVPKVGLTFVGWEEGDEFYKDGVLVWKSESRRYYSSILALVDGKVRHYTTIGDDEELVNFNDHLISPNHFCDLCPDGHGTEIVSDIEPHDVVVMPGLTRDGD